MSSTFNVADLQKYYPPEPGDFAHSRTNAAKEGQPDVTHLQEDDSDCAPCCSRSTITLN